MTNKKSGDSRSKILDFRKYHAISFFHVIALRYRTRISDMLRDFFLGFIKIHILHHASKEPVYGLWLIEELGRHGYKLSPGTLYPILHKLEENKLLKSYSENIGGKIRKYYRATAKGMKTLSLVKEKINELIEEVMD